MSYITNLVHRTLGVTPVAQPVIQAKFAPQSPSPTAAVQDSSAAQPVAPVSRVAPSLAHSLATTETGQLMPRPRRIDTHLEAEQAREEQSIMFMRQTVSVAPAKTDLGPNESESFLPPAPRFETPRAVPPAAQRVVIEAPSQEAPNGHRNAAQPGDDFRLMKTAPPAQATHGFAPPPPAILRSGQREMESVDGRVVRVHIGRVDVRMVTAATKEPRAAMPTVPDAKPVSLDDYLRARQRGTR